MTILLKYFVESAKYRAVRMDLCCKPPSSLGLAIDAKLIKFCGFRQGFFEDLTLLPVKTLRDCNCFI